MSDKEGSNPSHFSFIRLKTKKAPGLSEAFLAAEREGFEPSIALVRTMTV